MAGRDRINGQTCNTEFVSVYKMTWNLAKNDASEQRRHEEDCSVVDCERRKGKIDIWDVVFPKCNHVGAIVHVASFLVCAFRS